MSYLLDDVSYLRQNRNMPISKLALPAFAALASVALCPAQPVVTIHGLGASTVTLSLSDLARLPQQTVQVAEQDKPVTFEGVLLLDVLSKVDLPLGETFHKTGASYYLVVDAADGYKAVFAWAEIDPSFTDRKVYLVTKRDDKPLADSEGPFRLVVPGEKRGARGVHQVTALTVRQAN
jgi:hypothetical protein